MPLTKQQIKATRRCYSAEFKNEALGLSEQVGGPDTAMQLGLNESQLYA